MGQFVSSCLMMFSAEGLTRSNPHFAAVLVHDYSTRKPHVCHETGDDRRRVGARQPVARNRLSVACNVSPRRIKDPTALYVVCTYA